MHSTKDGSEKTRQAELEAEGLPLRLPEIREGLYLLEAWMEAGPTMQAGMGDAPLDWVAIDAFARCTGAVTERWEMQAIHRMSRLYMAELTAGSSKWRKPPVDRD